MKKILIFGCLIMSVVIFDTKAGRWLTPCTMYSVNDGYEVNNYYGTSCMLIEDIEYNGVLCSDVLDDSDWDGFLWTIDDIDTDCNIVIDVDAGMYATLSVSENADVNFYESDCTYGYCPGVNISVSYGDIYASVQQSGSFFNSYGLESCPGTDFDCVDGYCGSVYSDYNSTSASDCWFEDYDGGVYADESGRFLLNGTCFYEE
ncbi:MAG: hypothetical protein E7009_01170 [Alphaproteobacteria bacterium]|nr:hypothetical protein [Alphaproteobacteria bacterium]